MANNLWNKITAAAAQALYEQTPEPLPEEREFSATTPYGSPKVQEALRRQQHDHTPFQWSPEVAVTTPHIEMPHISMSRDAMEKFNALWKSSTPAETRGEALLRALQTRVEQWKQGLPDLPPSPVGLIGLPLLTRINEEQAEELRRQFTSNASNSAQSRTMFLAEDMVALSVINPQGIVKVTGV